MRGVCRVSSCIFALLLSVLVAVVLAAPAQAATTWKEDWTAIGFFQWIAATSDDQALVDDANAAIDILRNGTGSNDPGITSTTTFTSRHDASSLLNMFNAASALEYSNSLRANHSAGALQTNCQMMAISILQCNYSAEFCNSTGMLMHCQAYPVAENISMGYNNPFEGWYTAEKKLYDSGTTDFSQVGHYLNIINDGYNVSGFAYNTTNAYGEQSFNYSADYSLPIGDYIDLLIDYIGIMEETQDMPIGDWRQDSKGWWYRIIDGSYPHGGIDRIEGKYYFFDNSGYMKTGWQQAGGQWYYFESSGAMVFNKWVGDYYVGSDGAMLVNTTTPDGVKVGSDGRRLDKSSSKQTTAGWKKSGSRWWYQNADGTYPKSQFKDIDGKTYYFDGSGWMATGWKSISGSWYFFGSNGAMAKGWAKSGSSWYYLRSDGKMQTGWLSDGGKTYYLKSSGAMATGWQKADGAWYFFRSDGSMAKGWVKSGSSWYYLHSDGTMATGWLADGNKTYYLKSSGAMATGWQKVGNAWYWFDGSGSMGKSRWVGNYYLNGDGTMAVSTWIGKYHVDANGKWDKTK